MQGLTEGRIVHFVLQLIGQVGTTEYAAIVSRVHVAHNPEAYPPESVEAAGTPYKEGDIDLFAFMENHPAPFRGVPYSAEKVPYSWHWIEKA